MSIETGCDARNPAGLYCTEPPGHVGQHVATDGMGTEYARWGDALAGPTLRDLFAMAALVGQVIPRHAAEKANAAREAYEYADAMLAARKGGSDE